jgi:RHS repeat-associated protein
MNEISKTVLLVCIFCLFLSETAPAQFDPAAGIQPFSSQVADSFASVDLASGNIFVNIPVRGKTGKIPFSFALSMNSHAYVASLTCGSGHQNQWEVSSGPFINCGVGGGRISTLQGVPPFIVSTSYLYSTAHPVNCSGTPYNGITASGFYVLDSTGVQHLLSGHSLILGVPCQPSNFTATTTDGTGYTMIANSVPGAQWAYTATVYDKSGNIVYQPYTGNQQILIQDPDGATITSTVTPTYVYTDSLGVTALQHVPNSDGSPGKFQYTDGAGITQTFQINYSTYTVQTAFGCSNLQDILPTSVSLPSSITTPTGIITLSYETTPGHPSNITSRLAGIAYPSGGSVSYQYSGGNNGVTCSSQVVPQLTRIVDDNNGNISTWTYVNNRGSASNNYTVAETDPAGDTITHYFSGEYETERIVTDPTLGHLSTIISCYNGHNSTQSGCTAPTSVPTLPITQTDVYKFVYDTTGASTASVVTTLFNSYGLPTTIKQYDWGQSFPPSGTPAFTTTTVYNSGASCGTLANTYEYDRPCSVTKASASGQTGQTTYSYTLGHPTQTQKWVVGSTFLTSSAAFNGNGTVASTTDANTGITTYGYASGCNNLVVISAAYPVNSLTNSQTWDCSGGVITSTTGMDGHQATMTFADPLWRATNFTDPSSAATAYSYNSTAPYNAESAMAFNSSALDTLNTLDGLARKHITQRRQSPSSLNFDSVETDYDIMGRVHRTTMPYVGTSGQTNASAPATITQYDALGRPKLTTDGGGGTTSYIYNLDDVLITAGPHPVNENTKQRQLEYDGLGRLKSVCELTSAANGGSACGQYTAQTGFLTTYTYGANTMTVNQNANGTTTQTRSYTYDGLGRLTLEVNPESGSTFYTYDSDSSGTCSGTYKGDLIRRNTPQGTTCYTYDKLHRLLSKTYPSNTYTDSKYFVYDSATVNGIAMSNVKGRMAEAYTCPPTGSCTPKKTDLGFSYTPRGEIQSSWESTPNSGGYLNVCTAYWPSGLLKSLNCIASLPYVIYGNMDGSGLDGEGRVTNIWAQSGNTPLSSVAYNNTNSTTSVIGALTGVTYGSGDSDAFTYDPNTGRMASYAYTVGTTQSVAGTLSWNSIGSLAHLGIVDTANSANSQTCNYVYDDLSRVVDDYCGPAWHQTFTFDPFGNISKTATIGTSFLPIYNQSTNQISSLPGCPPITYDGNGNLTNDCTHTYGSDSDGRVTSIDGNGVVSDALGRQVEWTVGSGHRQVVYDPLNRKFALMNGVSTLVKGFIPLPGGGTMVDTPGVLPAYYRHSDWLGSSRLATTQARGLYYDGAYAAYGEDYTGTGTTDLDFTGQNQDTAAGLYDFLYRKYSPVQGRWISPDPSGLAAVDVTNPQSWNRYVYVSNSPLSHADPTGLRQNRQEGRYGCNPVANNCPFGSVGGTNCILDGVENQCGQLSSLLQNDEFVAMEPPSQTHVTHTILYGDEMPDDVIGFGTLWGVLTMPLHYIGHFQDIFSNNPPTSCNDGVCSKTWNVAGLQGFRAVSLDELQEINSTAGFGPSPGGGLGKYFYPTYEQAQSFGERMYGPGNYGIVSGSFPEGVGTGPYSAATEGQFFLVPNENLPLGIPEVIVP